MFFVIDVESRTRPDHPLRPLKWMIDDVLAKTSSLFDTAYSDTGRPACRQNACSRRCSYRRSTRFAARRSYEVDFHGHKRGNATHASRTDPETRLYHIGHAISKNRHGLVMAVCVTEAAGDAEPAAALSMVDMMRSTHGTRPRTLGKAATSCRLSPPLRPATAMAARRATDAAGLGRPA